MDVINLLIVEDNARLRPALAEGFNATGVVRVVNSCDTGEAALDLCLTEPPDAILMDAQLAGPMNGIEAAIAIRRELPRMPVVFYSIQDDDAYYRAFLRAGILTHFAYVRKSNYLLPAMLVPLLRDAIAGRSYIDGEIASRVQEVRHRDRHDPLALLEPGEQQVAKLLAQGLTNEQIAAKMGFRDKRTISRVAGQIYAAWDLNRTATDEKIARTRAAIIASSGRLIRWDDDGDAFVLNERDEWTRWQT
jgi:DNA-binding NarL/FixJ family response regulator